MTNISAPAMLQMAQMFTALRGQREARQRETELRRLLPQALRGDRRAIDALWGVDPAAATKVEAHVDEQERRDAYQMAETVGDDAAMARLRMIDADAADGLTARHRAEASNRWSQAALGAAGPEQAEALAQLRAVDPARAMAVEKHVAARQTDMEAQHNAAVTARQAAMRNAVRGGQLIARRGRQLPMSLLQSAPMRAALEAGGMDARTVAAWSPARQAAVLDDLLAQHDPGAMERVRDLRQSERKLSAEVALKTAQRTKVEAETQALLRPKSALADLPGEVQTRIRELGTARQVLGKVKAALGNNDVGAMQAVVSNLAGRLPREITQKWDFKTETDLRNNLIEAATQMVGVILESGKLTDNDFPRYRSWFPTAADAPDVAASKLGVLDNVVALTIRGMTTSVDKHVAALDGEFGNVLSDEQRALAERWGQVAERGGARPPASSTALSEAEQSQVDALVADMEARARAYREAGMSEAEARARVVAEMQGGAR